MQELKEITVKSPFSFSKNVKGEAFILQKNKEYGEGAVIVNCPRCCETLMLPSKTGPNSTVVISIFAGSKFSTSKEVQCSCSFVFGVKYNKLVPASKG